jgi:hypothetical protein
MKSVNGYIAILKMLLRGWRVGATVREEKPTVSNVMLTQKPGPVYQIAYVVENLSEAMDNWLNQTSAGPFFLFEHFEFVEPVYRGVSTVLDISIALGYSGELCIELIEQHDERPSVYQEEIKRTVGRA